MKKRLSRKEYTEISEEIRAAVEEVAKKHGFTSSIPSFTFNEGVKGIFNGVLRLMDGDDILFTSKEHTTADTYAKDVVFPGAHILGSKFKGVPGLPALTFTIVDIRKSKLTPFVVVSEEGIFLPWCLAFGAFTRSRRQRERISPTPGRNHCVRCHFSESGQECPLQD